MADRRNKWNQNSAEEMKKRMEERQALIDELTRIRIELQTVDVHSTNYEILMKQRAETAAKIATL